MIALKIAEVKDFMNKLLCQDVFDHFLIQEAVITTNVSCHIDGTLQKDFYTLEELEEQNLTGLSFVPYGLLRSSCFNLIKGKKTPSYFKFSLLLSPEINFIYRGIVASGFPLSPVFCQSVKLWNR